jgi:fumarate reductase flavoprotein subunit
MKRKCLITVSIVLLALFFHASCGTQKDADKDALKAVMAPGTYTGAANGFLLISDLQVTVEVDETRILAISVSMDNYETKPILQSVIDKMIPRIIEHQSIAVDSITGATASSSGVKQAIARALTQALIKGGSDISALAAFQKIPPKKNQGVKETINTRVLVVGMGGSGTAAAMRAAETLYAANPQDVRVLAIDKAGKYGGTSSITSEMFAVNAPRFQERFNEGADYTDKAALRRAWLAYTEGDQKTALVDLLLDNSGQTVDWLMFDHGFEFSEPFKGFTDADVYRVKYQYIPNGTWVNRVEIAGYYDRIYADYTRLGGKYLLETEAYGLIYDNASKTVRGVKARNTVDGTEYEIYADAVILATGGFAGNSDMEKKYLTDKYYPLNGAWSLYGMYQNDGKMIQGAIDNGAGTYNISMAPIVHMAATPQVLNGFGSTPVPGAKSRYTGETPVWSPGDIPFHMLVVPNSLAVDTTGRRFTSEVEVGMLNPWIAGPKFYSIWSQDQVQAIREKGFKVEASGPGVTRFGHQWGTPAGLPQPRIDEVLQAAIDAGYVYKADTLSQLGAMLGMDDAVLEGTVNQYNQYCVAGRDEAFNKPKDFLDPVGEGPYYAITGVSYVYSTCGALDINEKFQVLLADGRTPINHLYAVGTDSIGVLFTEKKAYVTFGGAAQGWAYTSGYLAGKIAADTAISER